jgi:hypothetical protein
VSFANAFTTAGEITGTGGSPHPVDVLSENNFFTNRLHDHLLRADAFLTGDGHRMPPDDLSWMET